MEDHSLCSCGCCDPCKRKAAQRVAAYVLKRRFEQRRSYDRSDPVEQRYVHRQVRMLLAMTGLAEEGIYPEEEMRRSEWGRAMRERQ